MSIRILIADDHTLFREMLRDTITNKGKDYDVVGQAADGEQTLNLVTRHHPDLLLLDYKMPGLYRLSAFCQEVARRSSTTRILLLSGFREEEIGMGAAIGGARGYILKDAPITDLLTAISIIHAGGIWVDSYLPRYVFNTFLRHSVKRARNLAKLTPQELKILSLIAHGMGNDKIGTRLYISEKTVKNHLTHIFTKLRVSGRQQAVGRFLGGNKSTRREQLNAWLITNTKFQRGMHTSKFSVSRPQTADESFKLDQVKIKKALIVEDHPDLLDLLTIQLEWMGFTVIAAKHGKEGVEKAFKEKPHIILMDILMPGMDGREATHLIRSNPETHDIPILAATVLNRKSELEDCIEAGCNDWLVKPFTLKQLQGKVQEFIPTSSSTIH